MDNVVCVLCYLEDGVLDSGEGSGAWSDARSDTGTSECLGEDGALSNHDDVSAAGRMQRRVERR